MGGCRSADNVKQGYWSEETKSCQKRRNLESGGHRDLLRVATGAWAVVVVPPRLGLGVSHDADYLGSGFLADRSMKIIKSNKSAWVAGDPDR